MNDFEAKLNAILSDPSAMAQIADIARTFQSGPEEEPQPSQMQPSDPAPDLSSIGSLFGQIDPSLLQKLLPLLGTMAEDGAGDERMQLLCALRPFLKPERRDKIERAVKAARLIRVGKTVLGSLGDGHV